MSDALWYKSNKCCFCYKKFVSIERACGNNNIKVCRDIGCEAYIPVGKSFEGTTLSYKHYTYVSCSSCGEVEFTGGCKGLFCDECRMYTCRNCNSLDMVRGDETSETDLRIVCDKCLEK